jgi:hypothetical protein
MAPYIKLGPRRRWGMNFSHPPPPGAVFARGDKPLHLLGGFQKPSDAAEKGTSVTGTKQNPVILTELSESDFFY